MLNVLKLVLQLSLNVWLIVGLRMRVSGVAISTVTSSAVMAVGLLIYTVAKTGVRYNKTLALKMLAFSWPMWLAGIAGLYIGSSSRYYIRVFSSMNDVGLYALAERFSGIMLYCLAAILTILDGRKLQALISRGIARSFTQSSAFSAQRCSLSASASACSQARSFTSLPTPDFYPSTRAVPLLVLGAILACLSNFVSFSFLVTETTKSLGLYSYLTAAVVSLLYLILIPLYGYIGAACAVASAQAFLLMVTYIYGRKRYDMHLPIRVLVKVAGASACACVVGSIISPDAQIFLSISARALCWLGATLAIVYFLLQDSEIRAHATDVLPPRISSAFLRLTSEAKIAPKDGGTV